MAIGRRKFIGITGAAVAASYLPWRFGARPAWAFSQSSGIPLFGTDLRGIGPNGIPVAGSDGAAPVTGVTHYTINVNRYDDPGVVPALGATALFGYHPANPLFSGSQKHLGGIIVAKGRAPGKSGDAAQPIQITFRNNLTTLSGKHIIPNDITIPGANQGNFRLATHFHGGLVPWISDGGPFDWWDPAGNHGLSFLNNQVLRLPNTAAPNEAEYYYPLNQSARFGWYHDHAYGITRINAYAGVASGLIIRDGFELDLVNQGLPNYIEAGGNEIPLVIQDKVFVTAQTALLDPTWAAAVDSDATRVGSLWYAHVYERNRWRLSGNATGGSAANPLLPDPSVIPEFFGDTMLVNGTAFPKKAVEPRRYRLRCLNACTARFLNLQFYVADNSPTGITLDPLGNPTNAAAGLDPNAPGASNFMQIGTEGGFLPYPVKKPTNVTFNPLLPLSGFVVGPAERPDLVVDFSAHAGKSIILYNDAPAPFPVGDPRNDYFPGWNLKGNPVNAIVAGTPPNMMPNSRILMRFDVAPGITGNPDPPFAITTATNLQAGNEPLLVPAPFVGVPQPPPGVFVRPLTLNETFDAYGRLIQMLGTAVFPGSPSAGFGRPYAEPIAAATPTETPRAQTTEVWEIYNLTADVHPMHFHLVNVQVINRQPFQVSSFNGVPANFTGPATAPEPNERGWKETVLMQPGTVTRIIMTFDLASAAIKTAGGATIQTPSSPRTGGAEYVWHCHILEHEEHDMMRPLVVI